MSKIHPLSFIEEGAQIGENVTIEPFAVVKKNVTLEDGVVIKSHAYIDGFTTIKKNTIIWPSASIGTKTQDLKYKGEKTFVEIGENCEIREFVTINSSCMENSKVKVGNNCLIMAYCHLAHNCEIGNNVIMSNSAMLAGHVIVEDNVVIGGMTPVHQFCRIGCYAMIGGFSPVARDIPPYTIGKGYPYKVGGLNLIGLKRHNFPLHVRTELTKAFRYTFRMNLHLDEAMKKIQEELKPLKEIQHWVDFCLSSKRGLVSMEVEAKSSLEEKIKPYVCQR